MGAQHLRELGHGEPGTQGNKCDSLVFRWLICFKRLTGCAAQIVLLYYTSQCAISLLYCEKHIAITSYVVPSEVFVKEKKNLSSHFLS